MRKIKDLHLAIIYILLTYVISGFGYLFWFQTNSKEYGALFLFIPILAPLISTCVVNALSKGAIQINLKKCSIKGLLVGAGIPIFYYGVSILVYVLCGNTLNAFHMRSQDIVTLCIQWTFAGFCEEIGWRGFFLPFLKKHMSLKNACLITGFLWAGWHIPMLPGGAYVTQRSTPTWIILFTVGILCFSFIYGILSEMKIGRSIWTFVSIHAIHNILAQMIFTTVPEKGAIYLDDTGYIYLAVLLLFTLTMWILYHKKVVIKRPSSL
ncbi:CPBP family intramembrane glutamic endopeptidase [Anaerosporobacter faecicola]|uniref:CPBP family intramembrane glutamic endopeptidase n=1 Tax=Anaerosporobacter faecicola TaxID=2718714 RepID=UPI00143ABF8F|nr:CPBP family intramembrane glutamic endopeptidase [Anaerosporobacter faecicola]